MKALSITIIILFSSFFVKAADLLVEAENFNNKGGWVVDQQFMNIIGSPYLMAHGMGVPVSDASTKISFPTKGTYYIYVRTYNWISPWYSGNGPGKFQFSINGTLFSKVLGDEGDKWIWDKVGKVSINKKNAVIALKDLTGFNGRCDAIYFTTNPSQLPPSDLLTLGKFRKRLLPMTSQIKNGGKYDLVVIGGGVAGMCASVSAARLGLKVALIQDRPVLGGNNSSEIRVHLGGAIENAPYPNLGNLIKEFGPSKGGNAQPAENYEDDKKMQFVKNEKNIKLFTSYRAINVKKEGNKVLAVIVKHVEIGQELRIDGALFSDCTGDGTIGYLAGANYTIGRESRSQFNEKTAPVAADNMVMGSSVQWYSDLNNTPSKFPIFKYGVKFNEANAEIVYKGDWDWETGMNKDPITDYEQIRDYGLLVVFSNWSYLKNEYKERIKYDNRQLSWVAYIAGKRESRRLLGDHILNENDIKKHIVYDDASFAATWSIDLHFPDPDNSKNFPGKEFISATVHDLIYPYPVPYRCLYSRNIENLFMAGRDISVTHVALGTVRVMRTTGMMGEVVGMAASICKKHNVNPRKVYTSYLPELKLLMKNGTGKQNLPNNQLYNIVDRLYEIPNSK